MRAVRKTNIILIIFFLGCAVCFPARAQAPDWFRVFQYAPKSVTLRGCSECQGEPDDVCEVRGGAQVRALDEYARDRFPASDRIKLLRSRADPDCAVPVKALFGPRGPLELAAMRLSRAPPSTALAERAGAPVNGWPRAPSRRKGPAITAKPQRSSLRFALVCWGSEQGWPSHPVPGAGNACEFWLLPVQADGEPDLGGASFPLATVPGAKSFDPGMPLDESLVLGDAAPPVVKNEPAPARAVAGPTACGDPARSRTATLERFEQWEQQIRGARRSLDREGWTLNAAAWSGHCREMEVLRAALEQQLGCTVAQQGDCAGRAP